MLESWLLPLAAFLPLLLSPLAYALGKKHWKNAIWVMVGVSALEVTLTGWILFRAITGTALHFQSSLTGLGVLMCGDGFRALYAFIAAFMWLITSLVSLDYFGHGENRGRYALFTLMTLGMTVGLFLSDSFVTTFLFFECMSLMSYPWVAHEETPGALRAAQTYLYIAVIGGLCTLMGIALLPEGMATASYDTLAAPEGGMPLLPVILVLVGFAAKAGAFPLHIWLPKAHPVAPAPASALLSGMLTKTGVFGMLVITCRLMQGNAAWGDLIFRLGVITMLLGAVLAILSGNLKRTLACSSLSQIGFIMVGVGLLSLLPGENGLAAFGTVGHMVNHSLFKLTLFSCAGAIYLNTHELDLKKLQGYGRNKPLLMIPFAIAALGISGVPLLSGYLSKSLLHEGILELVHHLEHHGENAFIYQLSEKLFLLAGGMTFCYMTRLFIILFVKKNPDKQAEYDAEKKFLNPLPLIAILAAAVPVVVIGILPHVFETGMGMLSLPFLRAAEPVHLPVPYFSLENLKGAAISLGIGGLLVWLVSFLQKKKLPKVHFDLEDMVYRPLLALLCKVGGFLASLADRLTDCAVPLFRGLGRTFARACDGLMDSTAWLARKTVLSPKKESQPVPVGNRLTYALGTAADRLRGVKEDGVSYVSEFAALYEEFAKDRRKVTRSMSFGLMLFCLGLLVTLIYLLY
ncbi:MAG: NADH dehydrogenase [Clostridiales bacterium]|nr:NADH dehydrogenase [Clostridiales bacterium]